jgi:protein transport protein SEC31
MTNNAGAAPVIPANANNLNQNPTMNPNAAPAMPSGLTMPPAGLNNQPNGQVNGQITNQLPAQPASYQVPQAVAPNTNQSNSSPYSGTSMPQPQKPADPANRTSMPAPALSPTPESTNSSSMLPQPVPPPMDVPPMQVPVPTMTPMPKPAGLPSPQALTVPAGVPNPTSIPPSPVPLPVRARPQE